MIVKHLMNRFARFLVGAVLLFGGLYACGERAFGAEAAAGSRGHESAAQRTREFVVMGYEGISYELRTQPGPYLKTLVELLRVNPDQSEKTLGEVRSLARAHSNIMDFADAVAGLQSDAPLPASIEAGGEAVPVPSGPSVYSGDRLENALMHLTRGMTVTVYTKGGGRYDGRFEDYSSRRLWVTGASRRSFPVDDILAIQSSRL